MKSIYTYKPNAMLLLGIVSLGLFSCERDLSDEAVFATLPKTGDIFMDTPIGLGSDFYFPFAGSKPTAFSVDDSEGYNSAASIRIDVPNASDPEGNYAGAIFRIDGAGRNLTEFDALTFWAKASQGVIIDQMGFGVDFEQNKFQVTRSGITLGTNWAKYTIPIPDASKLIQERGMLWYSTGTQNTGGFGYTFWIDEVKFEKLGTIAQPQPSIFNGENRNTLTINGATIAVQGLTQTFNLASGNNVTVSAAPSYFTFKSSAPNIAAVNQLGEISVLARGTAIITAVLNATAAKGSIEITSFGSLQAAPTPQLPQTAVKSIFSDVYTNDTDSNFSPGFGGSTTETNILINGGDSFLSYTNNNFTGIIFNNTVDASALAFLHVDVFALQPDTAIGVQIRDIGENRVIETDVNTGNPIGDDKDFRTGLTNLPAGQWISFEIPLSGNIANQKNNLGAIILTGGPNFIFDNIYFY